MGKTLTQDSPSEWRKEGSQVRRAKLDSALGYAPPGAPLLASVAQLGPSRVPLVGLLRSSPWKSKGDSSSAWR